MRTSVQGKPAEWTPEIEAKWEAVLPGLKLTEDERVTHCNYFRPRPYRSEYDRGFKEEGFVYTVNNEQVGQRIINREGGR